MKEIYHLYSDMKTKVLQINTAKGWRGGERQTLLLLKGLMNKGIDVSLLCLDGQPLAEHASHLNIPIYPVKNQLHALSFLITHGNLFDILHSQTAKAFTLSALSKTFHKAKIIYTRRVDFVPQGILTYWKYKQADQLVGISEAICTILKDFGFSHVVKISSAVEPVKQNLQRARQLIKSYHLEGKKIIATTSALVPHKDPLTLLEAIYRLSKSRTDFAFLHFGSGPLEQEVRATIQKYHLEKVYFLMGFQPHVEDFFSIFDVFVMSSREEGLGSSVLDAFLYNVPVVSTDAGGLKELVSGRGEICKVQDADCLAKKISLLMDHNEIRQKHIKNAYTYVIQNHSLDHIAEQYIQLYQKLLEQK